jgi:hypothetical protein
MKMVLIFFLLSDSERLNEISKIQEQDLKVENNENKVGREASNL